MGRPHLIGAYGMFWERAAVNWTPGITPNKWQLLGFHGQHRPKLRVCDVRNAQGFYVLFDEFRATYVGLARGRGGIGARLKVHHHYRKDWNRFCWFAFDDIVAASWSTTWSEVEHRRALANMSADFVLRESEALLIAILGTSQTTCASRAHRDGSSSRTGTSSTGGWATEWTQWASPTRTTANSSGPDWRTA